MSPICSETVFLVDESLFQAVSLTLANPFTVSEADSVVKVAEWQQTYYSSDSGIQSGATTVRDDESSTEYSGRKKYTSSSSAASNSAASAGGVASGEDPTLESPSGEMVR